MEVPMTGKLTQRHVLAIAGAIPFSMESFMAQAADETFPVSKSAEDWRKQLSPAAFKVLREHGTERAGTSPLNAEKRVGVFHCAGCGQALYKSDTKFESGTGWPSFWQPIDGAIGVKKDRSFFMVRTEVHCSNCGGHLGHVFEDGPKPTGLRYCMNGVAMTFTPKGGES
jgi:peptide-methionine (R)-S-oxide reductase